MEETRRAEIARVMKNERWFSKSADSLSSRARGSAMAPSLSCSPSRLDVVATPPNPPFRNPPRFFALLLFEIHIERTSIILKYKLGIDS